MAGSQLNFYIYVDVNVTFENMEGYSTVCNNFYVIQRAAHFQLSPSTSRNGGSPSIQSLVSFP